MYMSMRSQLGPQGTPDMSLSYVLPIGLSDFEFTHFFLFFTCCYMCDMCVFCFLYDLAQFYTLFFLYFSNISYL